MVSAILELLNNGGILAVSIAGLAVILKFFYNYVTIKDLEKNDELKSLNEIHKNNKKELKEIYENVIKDYVNIINKFGDEFSCIKKELKKINQKLDNREV